MEKTPFTANMMDYQKKLSNRGIKGVYEKFIFKSMI